MLTCFLPAFCCAAK